MNWVLVFFGGGLGSVLRYLISVGTQNYNKTDFPFATFTANILSCFIIGLLYHYLPKSTFIESGKYLLITGFCGGFSTFSAFSIETFEILQKDNWQLAIAYVFASLICGIAAVWMGMQIFK